MKRGGRLGPLPRQIEIDLPTSRIDRQLGRLGAILGVPLIHVLERRDVLGVIPLIQLLQRRDHFFFLPYVLLDKHAHLNASQERSGAFLAGFIGVTNAHSSCEVANEFKSGH